jgi:cyanophycinase
MPRVNSFPILLLAAASLIATLTIPTAATARKPPEIKHFQYFRSGSPQDLATTARTGFALMGGGKDLDEAFRWMCNRSGGGDFLVLRATGDDAYNPYIQSLCRQNSVATLVVPSREAAKDPFVAKTIAHAEAIFIAGGDQANYIRFWMGTPVQAEINKAIQRGVPVGGTSAGLAVMGEWAYSAEGDKPDEPNLDGKTALADPLGPRVTLVPGFLDIPLLKDTITDSHFVKRDRMGRLLAFLAQIQNSRRDLNVRGLGIDERTAVLLDSDGKAAVVGRGAVYLVRPSPAVAEIVPGKPLDNAKFEIQKVDSGRSFDLSRWCCGSTTYTLMVEDGGLRAGKDAQPVY